MKLKRQASPGYRYVQHASFSAEQHAWVFSYTTTFDDKKFEWSVAKKARPAAHVAPSKFIFQHIQK